MLTFIPIRNFIALLVLLLTLDLAAFAESAIFWTSGPVKPGETVLLTGYFPKVEAITIKVWNLTPRAGDWQTAVSRLGISVKPLNATENSVAFALPGGPGNVFAFRLDEPGESPLYGRVNVPQVWWTLADTASSGAFSGEIEANAAVPGGTIRLFGRCLAHDSNAVAVMLISSSNRTIPLAVLAHNPYALTAVVPADTPLGKYSLRLQAVPDAADSESAPISFTVHSAKVSSRPTINVKDFGAKGDGLFDNSAAFTAAFSKATSLGGGEVRVPQGAYVLTSPLQIPVGVYIAGESADLTALSFPQTDTPPDVWISGTRYFGLRDLAIYCGNQKAIVSSDMSGAPEKSGHVQIRNVRIMGSVFKKPVDRKIAIVQRFSSILHAAGMGYETLRLSGPDIDVENSYLLGSSRSLYLYRASGAIVRNNKLFNGIWGWYNIDCSENIINENNIIEGADLLASGGSYSTFGDLQRSQNIYTAGNTYSRLLGNDREAFTSDGPGSPYLGQILKSDGSALVLKSPATWGKRDWHGAAVVIVGGRGAGQWQTIKTWNDTEVELTEPFVIAPDAASTIAIVGSQIHYIFFQNHFEDVGVSIQFVGTAIEHIVAGNDSTRAGGFDVISLNYHGMQPSLNLQFLQNEVRSGLMLNNERESLAGASSVISVHSQKRGMISGVVIRNNILGPGTFIRITNDSRMQGLLVEGNKSSEPGRDIRLVNCRPADVLVR